MALPDVENAVTPDEGAFRLSVVILAFEMPVKSATKTEIPVVAVLSTKASPPIKVTEVDTLAITLGAYGLVAAKAEVGITSRPTNNEIAANCTILSTVYNSCINRSPGPY
jgi:hypothetical protein